jgi:hypothetical protein
MYPYSTLTFWLIIIAISLALAVAVLNFLGGAPTLLREAPRRAIGVIVMTFGLTINLGYLGFYHLIYPRAIFYFYRWERIPPITADYHAGFWIYLIAAALFALVGWIMLSWRD